MNPVITLATSRIGPFIGMMLGRLMPYRFTQWLAARMAAVAAAWPKNRMVRAVRANQAVVRGLRIDDPTLSDVVFEVFRNAGQGYMAFFHGFARGRKSLAAACSVDDLFVERVKRAQAAGHGVFIVGPHMGNFDLALVALQECGLDPLVLTYRTPRGSYLADNAIRQSYGVELTPISPKSLRAAMRRLKEGGVVLTLVDRPDSEGQPINFFGRPAQLPTGHVRMALRSGARLQVGVSVKAGGRKYQIQGPAPIEANRQPGESEPEAIERLATEVMLEIEKFIADRPSEWLMYYPVWPQMLPR